MQALRELFGTDVGLLSLGGLAFMVAMGIFFIRFFVRHATEDTPPQPGDTAHE